MLIVRTNENRQLELLLMVFRDDATQELRGLVAEAPAVESIGARGRHWKDDLADAYYFAGLGGLLRNDLRGAATDFKMSTEFYESVGDQKRRAIALLGRSMGLWQALSNESQVKADKRSSKYRKAFDLCRESREIVREIKWAEGIAAAQEVLGTFYRRVGDPVSALDAYDACRKSRESIGDDRGVGKALIAIGTLHEMLEQFDPAHQAFCDALKRYQACGDRLGEVDVVTRLASLFCSWGKREEARKHALRSITIYEALGERFKAAEVMLTIARLYESAGEKEPAEELNISLDFAMKVVTSLDFSLRHEAAPAATDAESDTSAVQGLRVAALMQIGRIYNHMKKYHEARFFLENALLSAENIGDRVLQYQLHEELAESWEGAGDFQSALKHHRHFAQIRKEVAGEERQQEIAALQVRFDMERAERDRQRVEEMEREMRRIEDDVTAMAADLQKKSEFLKRLEALAGQLTKDRGKHARAVSAQMLKEIKQSRITDPTRRLFENQRDMLHREFIAKLATKHPNLTKTEIKVCSVIRLNLSLTAANLGELLCISSRTVDTHKSNVRKKIGLRPDNDLGTYLTGIE